MLCSNRITSELLDISLSPVEMYISSVLVQGYCDGGRGGHLTAAKGMPVK